MKNIQVNETGTKMRFETIRMLTIPKSYFFEYTALTELEIYARNLRELEDNNLRYLTNLKRFLFSAPAIRQIRRHALLSLYNLREIRLEAENLRRFDQDFTHMLELQKVMLILPKVFYFYNDFFKNNLRLETVEITLSTSNRQMNLLGTQNSYRNLKFNIPNVPGLKNDNTEMFLYLQKLSLEGSKITISNFVDICKSNLTYLSLQRCFLINLAFLKYLINLTYLNISYNNIILEDFSFYKNCKLRHLNLSYNNIGVIRKNYFYGLNVIHTLKMNQCHIFKYENSILKTFLRKITYINFGKNYFFKIKKPLFSKTKYIRILDLRCCMIEDISKKAFRSLNQLETLELGNNRIKNLYKNTFYKLTKLIFLNISHNALKEFNIHKLFQSKYVNNLKILNLNYNNITQIPDNNLANFPKLTDLDLKFNHIRLISDHLFAKLNNLNVLNLSYNSIEIIDSKAFDDLCCLKILNLGNNLIKYLDKDVFYMLRNLNFLDLSNNCIQLINHKIFNQNCKLENIQLDFNEITELPIDIFYLNDKLRFLNIAYNPLMQLITFQMFKNCYEFHLLVIDENMILKVDDILINKINICDF